MRETTWTGTRAFSASVAAVCCCGGVLLLADRLKERDFRVREYAFTSASRAALFDTLLQLIRLRRLRSFPHPVLREELTGLRWVEKAGVLRPDHSATGHDDAAVAVALAAQAVVALGDAEPGGMVYVDVLGAGWDPPLRARAGRRVYPATGEMV